MSRSNPFRIPAFLLTLLWTGSGFAQAPYIYQQQNYHQQQQPLQLNRNVGEQIPDIWDESEPLERLFTAVARRSWVDVEYLHWDLDAPRNQNIGAPISDVADPLTPFGAVTDRLDASADAGFAVAPGTNNLGMEDTSGVRGTLGVALNGAELEASFFGTQQTGDSFVMANLQSGRAANPLNPTAFNPSQGTARRPNVITPLTTNGSISTLAALNAFVYDESFRADIDTQLWGSEVLLLKDKALPNHPVNWQWLGGFRYISFDEDMSHVGSFNDGGVLTTSRVTRIAGSSVNNIYGPEIGARATIDTKYVSFSATPRIAFALNDHTSKVNFDLTDSTGAVAGQFVEEDIDFAPVVEVNLKLKIHVSSHLSLIGGYDFMYLTQTSRPNNNVVYDSTAGPGAGFTANIGQKVSLDDFFANGFNFGALFTY